MTRTAWWVVFVAVMMGLGGMASAQTVPAAPSSQAATVAVPTTPTFDLSQIFGAPGTGGISTVPAPTSRSCTLFECKQPCRVPGCFASCIDLNTCECETICQ